MRQKVLTIICILMTIGLVTARYPSYREFVSRTRDQDVLTGFKENIDSLEIPTFDINLDAHPTTRWDKSTRYFEHQIKYCHQTIMSYIPWYMQQLFWVVSEVMKSQQSSFNGLTELSSDKYLQYVGLAQTLDLPVHEVMLTNFAYELFAHCTSIVAHNAKGEIVHGRNMDYPLYDSMHNITYNANFVKNGRTIFKAVMFAGYTGVFTAMTPNKFAISINQRNTETTLGLAINLVRWLGSSYSPASLLGYVCEHAGSFEEAQDMLANMPLTAPVYYTVSGTSQDQGAIITRDRTGAADIWKINFHSPADWCIGQTNYDHWITPPPASDKNRSNAVRQAVAEIGKGNMSEDTLLKKVLQQSPILNRGTIYSTIMSAATSEFFTVRYI